MSLLIEICKRKTILSKSWLFLFPHRSTFNKNILGINGHSCLSFSFLYEFCVLRISLHIIWTCHFNGCCWPAVIICRCPMMETVDHSYYIYSLRFCIGKILENFRSIKVCFDRNPEKRTLSVDMQLAGRPRWGSTPHKIGGSIMCQDSRWKLLSNVVHSMLFQKSMGSMFIRFPYWPDLS